MRPQDMLGYKPGYFVLLNCFQHFHIYLKKKLLMKPWNNRQYLLTFTKTVITTLVNSKTSVLSVANPPSRHHDDLKVQYINKITLKSYFQSN